MPAGFSTETAPHDVVHTTLARLHTWIDEVPPPQRRLGKFIVAAAALHFAAFFFILIDNTRTELRHQVRTSVTLDDAAVGAAGASDDAYWDRLTDPRLFVLPQLDEARPSSRLVLPLDPGPVALQPVPLPPPAEVGSFPFLNQPLPTLAERVKAALHPARQPFAYQENPPPLTRATVWQWGDALASRAPASAPSLPSPVSDTEINPTRLRVAVAPDGTVSDVMLDETSKNPELDQQATLAALKLRFQPTDAPGLAWGTVTVAWYYTPKPQEVAPPTAPLAP